MPACALSFSRSLIDFPVVLGLAEVLEAGVPRDMDHRSSNPDKPLAGAVVVVGALFGAVAARARVAAGVDVVVGVGAIGESGCDAVDDRRVGVGDIVVAKD